MRTNDPNYIPLNRVKLLMIQDISMNTPTGETLNNLLFQILVRLDEMNERQRIIYDPTKQAMNQEVPGSQTQVESMQDEIDDLQDQLDSEVLMYKKVIAGLANEPLDPCVHCGGHLGVQARVLYERGLNQHETLFSSSLTSPSEAAGSTPESDG